MKEKVLVVGLGYVGLPLSINLARAGFEVYGFDTHIEKIQHLKIGLSYIDSVESQSIKDVISSKNFNPVSKISNSYKQIGRAHV
mgnify:CR=1 FL=1